MKRFWGRATRGLEWVAQAELESRFGARVTRVGHRSLWFKATEAPVTSRTLDDLFWDCGTLHGLGRARTTLHEVMKQVAELDLGAPTAGALRVSASFLGKRNFNRMELEAAAGEALGRRLKMPFRAEPTEEPCTWFRLHLEDEGGFLGRRCTSEPLHRRPWKTDGQHEGTLHPPVAGAMAFLALLEPGQRVADPFCGAGTLLIEAGLTCPEIQLHGRDIDAEARARTRRHAVQAGLRIHADPNPVLAAQVDVNLNPQTLARAPVVHVDPDERISALPLHAHVDPDKQNSALAAQVHVDHTSARTQADLPTANSAAAASNPAEPSIARREPVQTRPCGAERVLSNPPWGRALPEAVGTAEEIHEWLTPVGRAVLLVSPDQQLDAELRELGRRVHVLGRLRVTGAVAELLVIDPRGAFPEAPALERAHARQVSL